MEKMSLGPKGFDKLWNHPQRSNFCPRCGTLMLVSDEGVVNCDKCDYSRKLDSGRFFIPSINEVRDS